MAALHIHPRVLEKMVEHARREYPLECCGLLSGRGREIDSIQATCNQRRSRKEFFVPLEELFAFFQGLRKSGNQHLGIYHSHPRSECLPSARDVAEFHYQGVSYWIVSLQGEKADIGCFLWDRVGFKSVSFRVVPGSGTEAQV